MLGGGGVLGWGPEKEGSRAEGGEDEGAKMKHPSSGTRELRGVEEAAATGAHSWARQIGGTRSGKKKRRAPAPSGLRSGRRLP